MPRISLAVALGVGASGALVDVSSFASLERGIERQYGRSRQYEDIEAGTFTFVLDNQDGRFTPDNAGSPYPTRLVEGARACVQIGTRITPGKVQAIEPTFPDGEPNRAQVRITCEDMLGDQSRLELPAGWREAAVRAGAPVGYYPLDDAETNGGATDQSGLARGTYVFDSTTGQVEFEQPGVEHDRIRITGEGEARLLGASLRSVAIGRYFSFWLEPISIFGTFSITVADLTFSMTSGAFQLSSAFPSTVFSLEPVRSGREYFIEIDRTALTLKIDGVIQGALAGTTATPTVGDPVSIFWGDVTPTDLYLSDLAFTANSVPGDVLQTALRGGGAARWLELLDAVSPNLTLAALPAGLSLAPLALAPEGDTALDLLNQVMKAEQGHAYSSGTGTLTAPTELVTIRRRDRTQTVTASFDVAADLAEAPGFERPIRDLVSRVDARTPYGRATVVNAALASRAGSSTVSETVPFINEQDARAWAQDRMLRGANTRLQAPSIRIDGMTTQTDRTSTLLALVPGDRIRLTNLPSTQLGYSTWDAWVIGGRETHALEQHLFELFLAPVLDAPLVFNTARFMSGGDLKLTAAITNAATSFSVSTIGGRLGTASPPYTIQVDDEQMTVTACTGATPQVLTVTRGVNGTTAAAHAANALVEIVPSSVFVF